MNANRPDADPLRSIRKHLLLGSAAALFLTVGVGGWAATTEISGAVIATGVVVVETDLKKVQHPSGGVVGELLVKDGDTVEAGQILIRLDATLTRANLAIIVNQLDERLARQARLEAERDGLQAVAFPAALSERAGEDSVAHSMAGETRLFELRAGTRSGQKAQLRERASQLREEITGIIAQIAAKDREVALIDQELESVRTLYEKKLVEIQRVIALERDAARLAGGQGQLLAAVAQAKGRISEIELQVLQVDQDFRSEVAGELRAVQGEIAELSERKVAAEDHLRRIDIRAPQSGRVHELAVHTIGGVIAAGEAIMMIVPEADALIVELQIRPQDIDQVHVGQSAVLRFSALDQRTTPEISGNITRVSPELKTNQRTGAEFFTALVALHDDETARLGDVTLLPGMPVEGFVKTGERTVLSYFVKPIADQLARAFREG